jgi:peptide/nickel transport system permease protein
MGRFMLRRLGQAAVLLVLTASLNFAIVHLAPGDAVDVLAGEAGVADPGYLAALRLRFGLDQPLAVQFGRYLWNLARLDLGYSFRNSTSVLHLIVERLPATLLLMGTSIALAFVAGIALGVAAARHVNSLLDRLVMAVSLIFYATPLFWLGLMLIVLFTLQLGWLPSNGMYTIGASTTPLERVLDVLHHLILPATTLSLFYVATYSQLMRASMLEVYGMDFVRTARAKGLGPTRIAYRHVLRNAVLPMVTMLGIQIGSMLGGAIVVEVVFGWPGMGRLAFLAIFQRDYNLLLSILFLCSVIVVATNLAMDLLYAWLDPRIELEAA